MRSLRLCLLFAAGCVWRPDPLLEALRQLASDDPAARESAFQLLTQAGDGALPRFKAARELGARQGFPLVALLYAKGEGDAVPLELRARHFAVFQWPRAHRVENAIVEPYAWNEIERDLVRAGRPALRLLAHAMAKETPTEAKALQAVRAMLLVPGRGTAEELAPLLDVDRDLGGVRVCDVAAAALLYLARQEPALRIADRDARVKAAREWWVEARGRAEEEWRRSAVQALAGHAEARSVLELLVGETIDDPKEWFEKNRDWRPPAGPVEALKLLPHLSEGRARAWDANRRLEELTGVRLEAPRAERLGELCAALRLWQPPAALSLRWKRWLNSTRLRLSFVMIGHHPDRGANHVVLAQEKHFHATEDEIAGWGGGGATGNHLVYLQSRDLGTRLVYSEHFSNDAEGRGTHREFSTARAAVSFSADFKALLIVTVDEVTEQQPPRPPETHFASVRAQLRAAAEVSEGQERQDALRALGYCQDPADIEFLKSHRAGAALLLLGDPAALEFRPRLESHEIEMALRRAKDPRVRKYLEGLRTP